MKQEKKINLKGNQTPRIKIEPKRSTTDGTGAAMLMQEYGVMLDEWQKLIIDSILGKDRNGNYVTTSAGISISRQNGKSEILICRCFYGLIINGEKILYTAHQVRSVKQIFRRLDAMFTDPQHPEIAKEVKKIRYGIGEEAIELKNGGVIEFSSRSRQAARGFAGLSLIIFDEAQELTEDQVEALMATLSASKTGTRQLIYAGTPPYIGCTGEVFRRVRQSCIMAAGNGKAGASSWHEWGIAADNLQDIDLSDRQLWADCNPAYGYRLTEEFTEEEFKTLDPLGFARERLGWWAKPAEATSELAIDPILWDRCRSEEEKPEGKTAYGIKFTPDGAEVVLAGAIIPTSGKARITLIAIEPTGNGLTWLANWLNERYKKASCVVIDGKNGADVLIDKIRPAGGGLWAMKDSVIKPNAQNVITAASLLLNELNEESITWYAKQEELRNSAITATKRPISGGFGFGGQTSAPIEACSLALWGCKNSKRNPQRTMRIG